MERPSDKGEWARSIRHIEVALPPGTTYRAGDHLGVLPRNGVDVIRRVMRRFALDAGMYLTIIPKSGKHTHLPIDEPAPLLGVLGSCVELQDVASREDIEVLARYNDNAEQRAALEALAKDDDGSQARYRQRVAERYRSALDCSISSPPVGYRSRSTLTFCRRCGPATTPSPPRHWSRRRSAASLWGFCAPPRAPATASSRGSAPTTWLPRQQIARFSCSYASPLSPSASPRTRMSPWCRNRPSAVPRFPARAGRNAGSGGGRRTLGAVFRLPLPAGLHLRRRVARFRETRGGAPAHRVFPPVRGRAQVCPARDAGPPGRSLGADSEAGGDPRVRQRQHHGAGSAGAPLPTSTATAPAAPRKTRSPGSPTCGRRTGSWRTSGAAGNQSGRVLEAFFPNFEADKGMRRGRLCARTCRRGIRKYSAKRH